jgi:hypothetical protein
MADTDFGDFKLETTHKPVAGVASVDIPEALAAMLAEHVPAVLKTDDMELTLTAKDEATAKRLALYARAWGGRQEPKLYIRKLPNRRDQKENVARLSVALSDDVPQENRPGRRAASK